MVDREQLVKMLSSIDRDCLKKELLKRSFHEFVRYFWDQIEPNKFVDGWHIKAICDHLQAVQEGKSLRLIINIPPRCGKSLIVAVLFPAWCWVREPCMKLLTGSYAKDLATRDTSKTRNLFLSKPFMDLYGDHITFAPDQNQKTYYRNVKNGERLAFSMGGTLTGSGGDIIIIDDALNAKDAHSKLKRDGVNNWFDEALTTRLNNQRTGRIVVIMQRLHEQDLAGYLIGKGNNDWIHLMLPMRFEKSNRCITPYCEDPRTEEGELLTDLYDEESLTRLERDMGSYAVAGQLQQRPAPAAGGMIKSAWFKYYKELPYVKRYTWSFDTAIKTGEQNDFSVGTLWAECDNGYYLVDLYRNKAEYPELLKDVQNLFSKHSAHEMLIEDKASGQQLIQDFRRIGKIPVIPIKATKDKITRLSMVAPQFESGRVFFPLGKKWLYDVTKELINFPYDSHDDIVDSVTQYLNRMIEAGSRSPTIRSI